VIAADGTNGALRAAVSVMVAADNSRIWRDVNDGQVSERPVSSLPEVVRAAAEGTHVTAVHVGTVRRADQLAAVVIWFGSPTGATDADERRAALDTLGTAADEYLTNAAEAAAERTQAGPAPKSASNAPADIVRRNVGSDDPDVDALTGLASRNRFDRELDDFEGDEATLLLIDLDHFSAINDEHGHDSGNLLLQEVAVRLAAVCRKTDLVARLDADEFAIVLNGVDRATGMETSKRLLSAISEPLPPEIGPESVGATLAYAHEFGLVDMEELFESADGAVASAKRSARGRIVVAS
jgi:diguanylate cyclase (GGDEF)-like protein